MDAEDDNHFSPVIANDDDDVMEEANYNNDELTQGELDDFLDSLQTFTPAVCLSFNDSLHYHSHTIVYRYLMK
jgi:hypothetical protein